MEGKSRIPLKFNLQIFLYAGVSSLRNLCILAAVDISTFSCLSIPSFLRQQVVSSRKAQEKHVPMKPKLCKQSTTD